MSTAEEAWIHDAVDNPPWVPDPDWISHTPNSLPDYSAIHGLGVSSGAPARAQDHRVGGSAAMHQLSHSKVRNYYLLHPEIPGNGQAASFLPETAGVKTTDKAHNRPLDGHFFAQVANHLNGLFALNTAATSEHSSDANSKAGIEPAKTTADHMGGGLEDLVSSLITADQLPPATAMRNGKGALVVADAQDTKPTHMRGELWTGEWTVPQLVGVGMGVLAGGQLLGKVAG